MKSSKRRSSTSLGGKLAGLALVLSVLLLVFKQTGYKMKAPDGENVLGTSSNQTTRVTRTMNGVKYTCARTNCDKVKNISVWEQDRGNDKSQGKVCKSVRDNKGNSICNWTTGYFSTHQCNVEKSIYRNKKFKGNASTPGGLNQAFTEDSENIVYYNCAKIPTIPTPTRSKPKPTPLPTSYTCKVGYGRPCGYGKCDYFGNGTAICTASTKCVSGKCVFKSSTTPTPKPKYKPNTR